MVEQNPFPAPTPSTVCSEASVLWFVWERECMRIAKESGYADELTSDPILQRYRFTNVRRRDDRVSRWLLENYYPHFTTGKHVDWWFLAAVARLINWPPTLEWLLECRCLQDIADDFCAPEFIACLDRAPGTGGKVYGSAYMLYPGHEAGRRKSVFIAEVILQQLVERAMSLRWHVASGYVEKTVDDLSGVQGLNTFMGGQIAADLTYLPGQLDKAHDLYTYAPRGPGSQRGLNYLYGFKANHEWEQASFNEALIHLRRRVVNELDIHNVTLHDIQSIAGCEFGKYCRTLLNEGKPRQIYKPETAF